MSNIEEPFGWWVDNEKLPFFKPNRRKYCGGPSDEWEEMHKNKLTPLYTSPPPRKPLSDDELPTNNPKINTDGERLAFHAGIRWAEHQHGITGKHDE